MGKALGWARVPTRPGMEGVSVQGPPQPGPCPESHFLNGVQEGRGPGSCPPRVSIEHISLGGCVLKVVVVAHIPTHPHPRITQHRAFLLSSEWDGQAMWVINGVMAVELVPPGLTSLVPTATGALLAPYLDGVNSCSPNPEKVGEAFSQHINEERHKDFSLPPPPPWLRTGVT